MNLLVHGWVDGVCDGHKRSLVEAKLPHHVLDRYSSTYMSWTSGVFVIQKSQSRKHRDKRPCGARVATKVLVNGS
jgi:hypothetical protein